MLGKRLLTAAAGIPLAVYIVNTGGLLFLGVLSILLLTGFMELYAMLRRQNFQPALFLGAIIGILMLAVAYFGNPEEMGFLITLLLLGTLSKLIFSKDSFTVPDAAFTVLITLYVGWLFSFLVLLRNISSDSLGMPWGEFPVGAAYTWFALLSTWASDTFAYFVGSSFGKHKLCPHISPGKTVEGAIGGLVGSILVAMGVGAVIHMPLSHSALLGMLIGFVAPLGDLVESIFKRYTGIKDSGKLFPGHGGVLDRFDSILFVAPVTYYYLRIFILN
jgi:phosphatidate cytidylyltransferase